ncbi:hypothetical protein EDB95_3016 [Dinghuibacter silviterrae]|uniref:Uncharacterized protein n=1 Tax=Dinghuibacter silviterrae TaxID=1539049 RepID=A0A4R8DUW1_9BACT|nr:hypothetical protein EDB95_3016 [Dinghuibacter silviterrae]
MCKRLRTAGEPAGGGGAGSGGAGRAGGSGAAQSSGRHEVMLQRIQDKIRIGLQPQLCQYA